MEFMRFCDKMEKKIFLLGLRYQKWFIAWAVKSFQPLVMATIYQKVGIWAHCLSFEFLSLIFFFIMWGSKIRQLICLCCGF